jgi:hypothetical protein
MTGTTSVDDGGNLGWIAGFAIVLAVFAVAASLWIYFH